METVCKKCGEEISLDFAFENAGHTYCEKCANDLFIHCRYCDGYELKEHSIKVNDGRMKISVCKSCCEDNFFLCNDCGEYHSDFDRYETCGGNHICYSCIDEYNHCNICEKYHKK